MQGSEILEFANLRVDGRAFSELRSIRYKLTPSVGSNIDGSVYYEQGLNKVNLPTHQRYYSDTIVIHFNCLLMYSFFRS